MKHANVVAALLAGTVFGLGLGVAQMTNPEKVLAFLTLTSAWDASLLLVMGAAVAVTVLGYRIVLRRKPIFATRHSLPTRQTIDKRLLGGAALFGIGWGLAGYCPGPALAGLLSGSSEPLVFLAALLAGSELARRFF